MLRTLALALAFVAGASAQDAYSESPITFDTAPGVTLAATLTVPAGDGPFPGVVLVSGSGLQDRDGGPDSPGFPAGYRMYRDIAHALAARGVASLRYDERGAGESTAGEEPDAVTSYDYAQDAAAAARVLDARPEIGWVGIVGHSEGGAIAPLVATAEPAVDGVVMVAGPGISGRKIILAQNRGGLAAQGVSPAGVEAFLAPADSAFVRLAATARGELSDADHEAVQGMISRAFLALPAEDAATLGLSAPLVPMVVAQQMAAMSGAWFRAFLALDPVDALAALDVPALALFFELDQQVDPALNAGPVRDALGASASPDWAVVTLDGLNHVFQRAETGSPAEYATLPGTVDPEVTAAIADWVLATAGE
ncbi:alpha/beta hydrolase family protein [Rubrivirga sp. IMCC45206]|uniref:alpha/beta hydrolase family protein n=1 Tax=Rubrivirga sp. IMCC45206 TaxID=3391614 RepID=UPI0039901C7B